MHVVQPERLSQAIRRSQDYILSQQLVALVAAVVGLAHRGLDADLGGDAGEDELCDAALASISPSAVA